MTLVLIFQDGNGAATGSAPGGGAATTYVQAIHRKAGARQPDVPSHGGGSGLAMWGWLKGVNWWRQTTPNSAPQ